MQKCCKYCEYGSFEHLLFLISYFSANLLLYHSVWQSGFLKSEACFLQSFLLTVTTVFICLPLWNFLLSYLVDSGSLLIHMCNISTIYVQVK